MQSIDPFVKLNIFLEVPWFVRWPEHKGFIKDPRSHNESSLKLGLTGLYRDPPQGASARSRRYRLLFARLSIGWNAIGSFSDVLIGEVCIQREIIQVKCQRRRSITGRLQSARVALRLRKSRSETSKFLYRSSAMDIRMLSGESCHRDPEISGAKATQGR